MYATLKKRAKEIHMNIEQMNRARMMEKVSSHIHNCNQMA